jgi:hypothetical protein
MQFTITGEHRYYLEKHRMLELEQIISGSRFETLKTAIKNAMRSRLGDNWKLERSETLFVEGHDLHCSDDELQRIISQRSWVSAFSELLDCRPMRLGFDQYFPVNRSREGLKDDPYRDFLNNNYSLEQSSCIKGIKGGLLICIEAPTVESESATLPQNPGDAILYLPDMSIPTAQLNLPTAGSYFLVTYCDAISLYVPNKNDPHIHTLKRWGYVFGDKLKEPHYPIIYR